MTTSVLAQLLGDHKIVCDDLTSFWAFSGIIGAGKSTLAEECAATLHWDMYRELGPDQSDLSDFYADMARHSFKLEVTLTLKRYLQHKQAQHSGHNAISDRSIYEDLVFANALHDSNLLSTSEYIAFLTLTNILYGEMRAPTVIIHLDISPEVALERIRRRGRKFELGITLEYLQKLHAAYDTFLSEICNKVPVVRIDNTGRLDPADVIAAVRAALPTMGTVIKLNVAPRSSSASDQDLDGKSAKGDSKE